MSESGGMSVNCLTAGGQNVATDVKGNITTLPVNLRPAGATTAMNLNGIRTTSFGQRTSMPTGRRT